MLETPRCPPASCRLLLAAFCGALIACGLLGVFVGLRAPLARWVDRTFSRSQNVEVLEGGRIRAREVVAMWHRLHATEQLGPREYARTAAVDQAATAHELLPAPEYRGQIDEYLAAVAAIRAPLPVDRALGAVLQGDLATAAVAAQEWLAGEIPAFRQQPEEVRTEFSTSEKLYAAAEVYGRILALQDEPARCSELLTRTARELDPLSPDLAARLLREAGSILLAAGGREQGPMGRRHLEQGLTLLREAGASHESATAVETCEALLLLDARLEDRAAGSFLAEAKATLLRVTRSRSWALDWPDQQARALCLLATALGRSADGFSPSEALRLVRQAVRRLEAMAADSSFRPDRSASALVWAEFGTATLVLAEVESPRRKRDAAAKAVRSLRAALERLRPEVHPRTRAMVQTQLARALLGRHRADPAAPGFGREEAVQLCREARTAVAARDRIAWADANLLEAEILALAGRRAGAQSATEQSAADCLGAAAAVFTRADFPRRHQDVVRLGQALGLPGY